MDSYNNPPFAPRCIPPNPGSLGYFPGMQAQVGPVVFQGLRDAPTIRPGIPTTRGWVFPSNYANRRPKRHKNNENNTLYCSTCNVFCSSPAVLQQHTQSQNHKRRLTGPSVFKCDVCNITCSSEEHINAHKVGAKHRKKLLQIEKVKGMEEDAAKSADQTVEPLDEDAQCITSASGASTYFCRVCTMECSSELQYKQHSLGRKHRNRVFSQRMHLMKSSVLHTSGAQPDLNDFLPCYQASSDRNPDMTPAEAADIVRQEQTLLDQVGGFEHMGAIKVNCWHAVPPSLRMVNAGQENAEQETNLPQMTVCSHEDCAVKRARAFYSAWLLFQNASMQSVLEQRRLRSEAKKKLASIKLSESTLAMEQERTGADVPATQPADANPT